MTSTIDEWVHQHYVAITRHHTVKTNALEKHIVVLIWKIIFFLISSLITKLMGPTWGPTRADRTQVGPMLAPWTLLSGFIFKTYISHLPWYRKQYSFRRTVSRTQGINIILVFQYNLCCCNISTCWKNVSRYVFFINTILEIFFNIWNI